MKQILQDLSSGMTEIAEVPCPTPGTKKLLIASTKSLISIGTERSLVYFSKSNLLNKARQQPDKVKQVLQKAKTDGVLQTVDAVRAKLGQPMPLGYCNVGIVHGVGDTIEGWKKGDRVVSNGHHAEMVAISPNLCAKIPDNVSDEAATFTVIGAIALQGIRLINPTLGETVVVTGLGIVGLLTVQLLRAHGCKVIGIDLDPERLKLAKQFGAKTIDLKAGQDPIKAAEKITNGHGVDAVIIAASTKSNEPMHQAACMCRKRGRIVLVGVAGLDLMRDDFYKKELSFQVSCSYGPGRYDTNYEDNNQDYPEGFVRWTAQRNFEAVLDMMAEKLIDVEPLISHRFSIDEAAKAYEVVSNDKSANGILVEYSPEVTLEQTSSALKTKVLMAHKPNESLASATTLGFIGAGNYAASTLIPAFKQTEARFKTICSVGGVSSYTAAKKFGFKEASTDTPALLNDPDIDAVVITTRHNTHSKFVCEALTHNKHVFIEKPLALTHEQLADIESALSPKKTGDLKPILMVGFNRRFAPQVQRMKSLLDGVNAPISMVMQVNAGHIDADHWVHDMNVGGGRIIGEACHFVDLMRFFAGCPIASFSADYMAGNMQDTATLNLKFEDGSIGTIHYFSNGNKSVSKERLEIFAAGRVMQLDNFRKLRAYGFSNFRSMNLMRQDKGQKACSAAFIDAIKAGKGSPIPLEEILEVSRVTIELST